MPTYPVVVKIGDTNGVTVNDVLPIATYRWRRSALDDVRSFVTDGAGESIESRGPGNYRITMGGGPIDLSDDVETALERLDGYCGLRTEATFEDGFPAADNNAAFVYVLDVDVTLSKAHLESYGWNAVAWRLDMIVGDAVTPAGNGNGNGTGQTESTSEGQQSSIDTQEG